MQVIYTNNKRVSKRQRQIIIGVKVVKSWSDLTVIIPGILNRRQNMLYLTPIRKYSETDVDIKSLAVKVAPFVHE